MSSNKRGFISFILEKTARGIPRWNSYTKNVIQTVSLFSMNYNLLEVIDVPKPQPIWGILLYKRAKKLDFWKRNRRKFLYLFSKTYLKSFLILMFGSCFSDKLVFKRKFKNELSSPQAFDSTSIELVSVEPTVPFSGSPETWTRNLLLNGQTLYQLS